MSWIAAAPEDFANEVVGDGQCVAFVVAAAGAPHTAAWRRGTQARGGAVPMGSAIATFEPDGSYGNKPGESHAAILVEEQPGALFVWDQWVGHPVSQRQIHFRGGAGAPVNDGDQFYVIEQA
jgi:hypothetical protein